MIVVRSNSSCESEKRYVVAFVLREFLGLEIEYQTASDIEGIQLEFVGQPTRLTMPSTFFELAANNWLSQNSLPEAAVNFKLTELLQDSLQVPVFFPDDRDHSRSAYSHSDDSCCLHFDLFGEIFFLLSRYEEAVIQDRDEYDRFPATASAMGRSNLLDRPIVNEHIELLWAIINRLDPALTRREHQFQVCPSHDIDHPAKRWRPLSHTIKSTFEELAAGRLVVATRPVRNQLIYSTQCLSKSWRNDPFDTISWLMDRSEENGIKSAFNYIPIQTDPDRDRGMPLDHPHVQDQWNRIHTRGHEIGIHPGFETFQHPETFAKSVSEFRKQISETGVTQNRLGGRQHYLRWETPGTARLWETNGLDYDSTLGFADRAGFRCGICHEFPMYDLAQRKPLRLRQLPLIAMEASVISNTYMDLGMTEQGFDKFVELKNQCRRYSGSFTLLWHNNLLVTEAQKSFYSEILQA